MDGLTSEAQVDTEEFVQLQEDLNQRCSILQQDLRHHMDAVVHRQATPCTST